MECGRRSSIHWPWNRRTRVKLRSAVTRGPNPSWRSQHPKARLRRNKGSPGVDGMTVGDAGDYLREHWPSIRSQLLEGTYQPQPVKRVEIPKPDGGVRKLGVP